jgi:hypothetical protein
VACDSLSLKGDERWALTFSGFRTDSLRGLRRIATCYDRNATNFYATTCLVAPINYWL